MCKKYEKLNNSFFLGVSLLNFIIYAIAMIISILLIIVSFDRHIGNQCQSLLGGGGASLIGAVLLSYFIDLARERLIKKEIKVFRKSKLNYLKILSINALERTFRNFYKINYEYLKPHVYALKFCDIKEIFTTKCQKMDSLVISTERNNYFNTAFNGFQIFEGITKIASEILSNQDLLTTKHYFSHNEIDIFKNISMWDITPNNFDSSSYNWIDTIEQLLQIKELQPLNDYYGVYDKKLMRTAICDKHKNAVNKPINIEFKLEDSIKNGLNLLKELGS